MFLSNKRNNVISESLRTILPIYNSDAVKKQQMCVTDFKTDQSVFVECRHIYGLYVLRYNYGVNRYLSELYIFTGGLHKRTAYYFCLPLFDAATIAYYFSLINKIGYLLSYNSLRKKFRQHTFWSISYMHRFPCRGQRRRSNAATAKRLHKVSYLNVGPLVKAKAVKKIVFKKKKVIKSKASGKKKKAIKRT